MKLAGILGDIPKSVGIFFFFFFFFLLFEVRVAAKTL